MLIKKNGTCYILKLIKENKMRIIYCPQCSFSKKCHLLEKEIRKEVNDRYKLGEYECGRFMFWKKIGDLTKRF